MSDFAAKEQKEVLRRKAMELEKASAEKLTERFLSLDRIKSAKTFFLFYGVGKELDTCPLIEKLLEQGKRVALPVCMPGRKLEAREIKSVGDVGPGRFGIPAPGSECPLIPKEEIEVVLVPNLLCDLKGYRLGYGGGYYDRWLAGYSGLTVSLCPPERLVEELPREPFDIPVDVVISE